jgi:hypothetical protein
MKLDAGLLAILFPLLYALLVKFAPGLPAEFSEPVFIALVSFILSQLGVTIVSEPVRNGLIRAGLRGFNRG